MDSCALLNMGVPRDGKRLISMLQREVRRKVKIERGTTVKSQLRNQHQRTGRAAVSLCGGSWAPMLAPEKEAGVLPLHCLGGKGERAAEQKKKKAGGGGGGGGITPL